MAHACHPENGLQSYTLLFTALKPALHNAAECKVPCTAQAQGDHEAGGRGGWGEGGTRGAEREGARKQREVPGESGGSLGAAIQYCWLW